MMQWALITMLYEMLIKRPCFNLVRDLPETATHCPIK